MNIKFNNLLSAYIAAVVKPPEEDINLYQKAVKIMSLGDFNTALSIVKTLCQKYPLNIIFLKTMASCFQNMENYQAAIGIYTTAHILMPDANKDCFYFIGICYYRLNDYKNAKINFEQFLNSNHAKDIYNKRSALYLKKCIHHLT